MHQYGTITSIQRQALQDTVRAEAGRADCFEHAAQALTSILRAAFKDSSPLIRLFVTAQYDSLPDPIRLLAKQASAEAGVPGSLDPATLILTLFGTSGARPEWDSRRTSAGHRVIPLVSRRFVESIPMVASLLAELDLPVEASESAAFASKVLGGGWYGTFFVKDATTSRDSAGRHIIPAQDFVLEQRVKSVWGIGVSYPNGVVATLLAFTREELNRAQVEAMVPLVRTFKVATTDLVRSARMFHPDDDKHPLQQPDF